MQSIYPYIPHITRYPIFVNYVDFHFLENFPGNNFADVFMESGRFTLTPFVGLQRLGHKLLEQGYFFFGNLALMWHRFPYTYYIYIYTHVHVYVHIYDIHICTFNCYLDYPCFNKHAGASLVRHPLLARKPNFAGPKVPGQQSEYRLRNGSSP